MVVQNSNLALPETRVLDPVDYSQNIVEALREGQARLAGIVDSAMDAIITKRQRAEERFRQLIHARRKGLRW